MGKKVLHKKRPPIRRRSSRIRQRLEGNAEEQQQPVSMDPQAATFNSAEEPDTNVDPPQPHVPSEGEDHCSIHTDSEEEEDTKAAETKEGARSKTEDSDWSSMDHGNGRIAHPSDDEGCMCGHHSDDDHGNFIIAHPSDDEGCMYGYHSDPVLGNLIIAHPKDSDVGGVTCSWRSTESEASEDSFDVQPGQGHSTASGQMNASNATSAEAADISQGHSTDSGQMNTSYGTSAEAAPSSDNEAGQMNTGNASSAELENLRNEVTSRLDHMEHQNRDRFETIMGSLRMIQQHLGIAPSDPGPSNRAPADRQSPPPDRP